jgi:hypothetical protein
MCLFVLAMLFAGGGRGAAETAPAALSYHLHRAVFRASASNRGLALDGRRFWVGEFGGWVRSHDRSGARRPEDDLGGGTIQYLGHGVAACGHFLAVGAWDAVAILPIDGRPLRLVKPPLAGHPCAVASTGKTLWVMNYQSPVLYEMDLDGRLLRRFTTAQKPSDTSQGITADCQGHLYVLAGMDDGGRTLLEYLPDGKLWRTHRLAVGATSVAIDPKDPAKTLFTLTFAGDPVVYEYRLAPGGPQEGAIPRLARPLRYHPDGGDIVIRNGGNRFNRPLYGTNTPFFVYAGDLPEILLSLPGKGGTLWLGLIRGDASKWLSDADDVVARYRAGGIQYEIRDRLCGPGRLVIDVLPLAASEGAVVCVAPDRLPPGTSLAWAFGGASGLNQWNLDTCAYCPEPACWLKPEDCEGNRLTLTAGGFRLEAPCHQSRPLLGTLPAGAQCTVADAGQLSTPRLLLGSRGGRRPILAGCSAIRSNTPLYLGLQWLGNRDDPLSTDALPGAFDAAGRRRAQVASQVRASTPDPMVNAAVPAICSAADGIWDPPVYVHGGVAWHMPYLGWRGAYIAGDFGWHDRARRHFRTFGQVQLKQPATGKPHADAAANLATQAADSVLYTRGYIPVHPRKEARGPYDMQQVFIDQLLWHFLWTGDLDFVREMWPVLVKHLEWERRCFDPDGDGLYENFANTFISDAHHYSGGGCAQASAYNYRAFRMAARLASLVGKDPAPFAREADKILAAMNRKLWMPESGWYAEYRDLLGLKRLHPSAELASVYHPIDSDVPDPLQAYQMLRYVDTAIEQVPVDGQSALLWSSNWVPYIWSVRNVCGVEVAHTALAYWQAGQAEAAFRLWRGAIVDAMFCCRAPGACIGTSEADAHATGLCTDFSDTVGMFGRSLVEGLFGIVPDALAGELLLRPGLPDSWPSASLDTPDVGYTYSRQGQAESYQVRSRFGRPMRLRLAVPARGVEIAEVTVNGKRAQWHCVPSVGRPRIEIAVPRADGAKVEIRWQGNRPARPSSLAVVGRGEVFTVRIGKRDQTMKLIDPQQAIADPLRLPDGFQARATGAPGHRTVFIEIQQGRLRWWAPVDFEIRPAMEICDATVDRQNGVVQVAVRNNTARAVASRVEAACGRARAAVALEIGPGAKSGPFRLAAEGLLPGTNPLGLKFADGRTLEGALIDWQKQADPAPGRFECVPLSVAFNDRVTKIFEHQYRSPRSPYCSLQIPLHGWGDWCYCGRNPPKIDDAALRAAAGKSGRFTSPQGIPFASPGPGAAPNVVFTSQWDNFPREAVIPLAGRARHAWFLVAGSTHPMHSQLDNGEILVAYADGGARRLPLHNPSTWWPIEADYQVAIDGFCIPGPHPPRIDLGHGKATLLDLPLDENRPLRSATVRCLANEVVVGLMAITLLRVETQPSPGSRPTSNMR